MKFPLLATALAAGVLALPAQAQTESWVTAPDHSYAGWTGPVDCVPPLAPDGYGFYLRCSTQEELDRAQRYGAYWPQAELPSYQEREAVWKSLDSLPRPSLDQERFDRALKEWKATRSPVALAIMNEEFRKLEPAQPDSVEDRLCIGCTEAEIDEFQQREFNRRMDRYLEDNPWAVIIPRPLPEH